MSQPDPYRNDQRITYRDIPFTKCQRIAIYFRTVWESICTSPPKSYQRQVILNQEDEGYNDAVFSVGWNSFTIPFTVKQLDRMVTTEEEE
jgi:hypothetical protein